MPVQCCAEGSITGLDDFYGPSWGQGIGLGHQEKYARKHNNVLCLIHFLGRIWHLLKPLRQPNWLLLRLHTPGSALAVSGGAIWSKISLGRVPKKAPTILGARQQEQCARKHNRVLCFIHFLDRFWHRFMPLRQPNWLFLRLHTPGSALAVPGGAIWSKISLRRVPKKNPNVTTFWVSFLKPLRNLCCGYVVSKWGPEKYSKFTFLGHLRPC